MQYNAFGVVVPKSLFAQYITERTNRLILETEEGFATYTYVNPTTVYIEDIFSRPDVRKKGVAAAFADAIVEEAKAKGCTKLIGSVVPSAKGSTESLKVLLAYGMALESASQDFIVFAKEIK